MGLLSSQIPTKKMVPLCRQMAHSHEAGIHLLTSLDMLARQQKDRQLRDVLQRMKDNIVRGWTLGDAARAESKHLSPIFVELLTAGEQGGKLDAMFRDLADYYEDRLAIKRSIIGALVYPCIQVAAAWFLGTFAFRLLGIIMASFGGRGEPFSLEAFIKDYLMFQAKAMGILGVIVAICILLSRLGLFGWVYGLFTTHMWPMSRVTRKFAMARFCRTLSLLLTTDMPIHRCIERSAASVGNPYIERELLKALPHIRQGGSLTEAFARTRFFTPQVRETLAVGENSGKLDTALRHVSQMELEEANHAVRIALRFLGVAILLAVAILIGYIVITFYMTLIGGVLDELDV